jgi:hypothetical protein
VDFVERWIGISPDGGNGTFELLILLVPLLIIVALSPRIARRARRQYPRRRPRT